MEVTHNPQPSLKVLLVEDNHDIAANICENLERAGHVVDFSPTAELALPLVSGNSFDLIVIDIMLPGMDGITLCQQIRHTNLSRAPILMLTARDEVDDKLAAFDAGADDYLTKPFSTREFLARAIVLSRRKVLTESASLVVGEITLNTQTQITTRQGQEISLGRIGYRILLELMKSSPGVLLRDDLEHVLWGEDRPDSDALRTHVSVLRKAIDKPFTKPMIHTVHGAGWRLIESDAGHQL